MTKILIVSPDRKWLSRECQESDVVRTLLDYTIDNNISVNRKIRDAHKLLLDISRSGALVIVSDKDRESVYVSETVNEDQYAAYLGFGAERKVINFYDWYDSKDEYSGYRIFESNGKGRDKFFNLAVKETMYKKLAKHKAKQFFRTKKSTF